MTAAQIQAKFGISLIHAVECERWVDHQYRLIAQRSPIWWRRDHAAIKANVAHCLTEMITDIWRLPRVKETA